MKTTPFIALAFLTAASAEAQTKTGNSGLPYDRISVVRSFGSDVHSTGLVGSVQVWDFLLGASHTKSEYTNWDRVTAKRTGLSLGYLVGTGDADLIFSVNYAKAKASENDGVASATLDADTLGVGIAWRQRINASFDYTFSYGHARTKYQGAVSFGGLTFADNATDSVDNVGLSLRYAFNKSVDFTLGYTHGLGGGGIVEDKNTWSVALGWFF
jgi:hypothetical protein